jgi:hypothetical protein
MPFIPVTWKVLIGKQGPGLWAINSRPYLKNNQTKKGEAQVWEHLKFKPWYCKNKIKHMFVYLTHALGFEFLPSDILMLFACYSNSDSWLFYLNIWKFLIFFLSQKEPVFVGILSVVIVCALYFSCVIM